MKGSKNVLPGKRLFIQVGSYNFGNVVNVVPGGVGVSFEGVEFLVFGHLSDETLEEVLIFGFILRLSAFFLLKFFSFLFFEKLLLLLAFSLDVLLHVHDLVLD